MTFTKKTVFMVLFLVLAGFQVMAFDGVLPGDKLFSTQEMIFKAVSSYWQVQEAFFNYTSEPTDESELTWNEAVKFHSEFSTFVGNEILSSLKKKQYGEVQMLSEIYKSLPVEARAALYPALEFMRIEITQENFKYLSEQKFREYFPGYGYTEPGYKYRKGRELDREYKGVTWQSEEHSISTTWNVNLTVSIDLLNILSGLVTGGAIKNLEVGPQFTMNVGGQPMIVCNVSFQRIKSIVTKTNRKFEINKVWFELLKAKSSGWSTGPWEICGKTYEILQEPTGEAVVTGIEGGK